MPTLPNYPLYSFHAIWILVIDFSYWMPYAQTVFQFFALQFQELENVSASLPWALHTLTHKGPGTTINTLRNNNCQGSNRR